MGKFRVPRESLAAAISTAAASTAVQAAAPAQNTRAQVRRSTTARQQGSKYQKARAHSRRARRANKLDKAKAAAKEAAKRAQKTKKLAQPCAVYVGNIGPDVDEKALKAHFRRCGTILSARIHCCGGVAMTSKPPPAKYHEAKQVRQYAIVTFGSNVARQRACRLEGTLRGREITVSVAISDLPEVREKITQRLEDYRSRMEPEDVHRARRSALRALKIDPTVLLDPRHEKGWKRRRRMGVMGHSFVGGIV